MAKAVKAAIVVAAVATGVGWVTGMVASGAAFASFAASTVGAYFARSFVTTLVLNALSSALSKKPSAGVGGTTITSRNPVAPRQVVYGRTRVGGTIVYMEGTDSNKYLHLVVALTGHEIDGYEKLYFNDEELVVDGAGNVPAGSYANKVRVALVTGTDSQAAFPDLVSESVGKWTANHRLRGCAAIYVRLEFDQDKFPSGVPNISVLLRGKKVYDPRTQTTVWSQNPALCLNDYLTNSDFGIGCDYASEIDVSALIAAANICDEDVPIAGGGAENTYEINGAFQTSANPEEVINGILSAMIGKAIWSGGKWRILAGAYYTPTLSFDEGDMRGGFKVQTNVSRRENFNSVKGTHVSVGENYIQTDFPPVIGNGTTNATMADYVTQDNGEVVYKTITLPFTTSATMAQRIAKIELERARQQITVSLPLKLVGLKANVGDVILLDNTRMGWSQKPFEVVSMGITYSEELGVDLELRETAADVFDWTSGIDQKNYDPAPDTNLPNPFVVGLPTSLAVTASSQVNNDGSIQPLFQVTWTAPVDQSVVGYEIQWQRGAYGSLPAETLYNSALLSSTSYTISGIVTEADYVIRVRSINSLAVRSGWVTTTGENNQGDTTAPSAPTNLSITTDEYRSAYLTWTNPTDSDYFQTIIYASFTNNSAAAVEVGRLSGTSHTYSGLPDSTTYYVWLKAVDYSGNLSAFNTGTTSGTSFATSGPVGTGATGADGATGPRSASGYVYYSTATTSAPSTPSLIGYDFGTGLFSSITSGWSASPNAPAAEVGKYYWAVRYNVYESTFEGTQTVAKSSVFKTQNFDGLVTFTNIQSSVATGVTSIDGGKITTGTLTADKIAAGSTAVASGKTFGLATANTVNTIYGVGYFNSSASGTAGVLAVSSTSAGGLFGTTSTLSAGGFYNATSTSYTSFRTSVSLATSTVAGGFANQSYAKYVDICTPSYGVVLNGSAVSAFTGAHDGLILKTNNQPSVGDLLVDVNVYAKANVYDSLCVNEMSSEANQKGVIGVFAENADDSHIPSALTIPADNPENGSFLSFDPQYTDIDLYQKVVINALGEGLINVCGEGGDIETGDLIVTSSVAGKGMKQSDDFVRVYTVAKSREDVTFSGPTEVKQIACVYISG